MQRDSTHGLFVFLLGVDIICFQGKLQQQASFIFCVRLASRMEKCEPREQNEQNLDHIKSRANASFDSETCYILLDLAKRTSLCKDKRGMKGQLLFQRIEALPRPPWNSARHRFYIIVGWLPGCSDWLYSRKCSKSNHDLKSGRSDKTGPHPFRRYHKHLVAYNDSILETSVTTIAEVLVKKMCLLSGYCNTIEQLFFCVTMEYGVNCQLTYS